MESSKSCHLNLKFITRLSSPIHAEHCVPVTRWDALSLDQAPRLKLFGRDFKFPLASDGLADACFFLKNVVCESGQ